MVLTWRLITKVLIVIVFACQVFSLRITPTSNPQDWRVIESLAEEYPYVVGLLNGMRDYICTGSIISKQSILTSGSCVSYEPKYALISAAMYKKHVNNGTVFEVAYTKLHADYIFDLKTSDPNVTRMHSNIGLVFVTRPVLEVFINSADIGNYYASELKEKKLIAVGYGRLGSSDTVALQHQAYHQTPCTNPKWYYCVCGIEYSTYTKTYTFEFGTGAPVLYGAELVGIAATPCGTLSMKNLGIKYNIFTVIGPYLPWIDKSHMKKPIKKHKLSTGSGTGLQPSQLFKAFCISLVISKALA
uniref:Peptidase S1 domain-containing protein n=1 Tax=Heliothis virescens TaxID=7102 RepID=A0A2A4K7U3_HELVI